MKITIKKWSILLFFALIFSTLLFFLLQKKPKEFNANRVNLIDNFENNYLFRGSNPFQNIYGEPEFSYLQIKNAVNQNLRSQNISELEDFYLIVISLLNADHYFEIQKERDFFKKYPNIGKVENFSEISPALLATPFYEYKIANDITNNYHLELTKLLTHINQTLKTKSNKPIVIYVHCNAGRDRTGVISATYRLLFKNYNLQQAVNKNIEEVGRNAESLLESSIISYCFYLKNQKRIGENFCKKI